jgi:hypothetical protein
MDPEPVSTAPYLLDFRECAAAVRAASVRAPFWWLFLGLGVAAAVAGATGSDHALIAPGIVFVAFCAYGLLLAPELRGRKIARLDHETTMSFSADGVRAKTSTAESRMEWSNFTRLLHSHDVYLLQLRNRTMYIIPRRAFASADDINRFHELATRRIQRK